MNTSQNEPSASMMPAARRLHFIFILLLWLSCFMIYIIHHHYKREQGEYIRQERKVTTRLNYLERIGRNDFTNYINLLQQQGNISNLKDTLFRQEFDSLTKGNTQYIAGFWMLIKSGPETADLDSLLAFRNNYFTSIKKYSFSTDKNQEQSSAQINSSFNTYRDLHRELMNHQYANISTLIRRSVETLNKETVFIIVFLISSMVITLIFSWKALRSPEKSSIN